MYLRRRILLGLKKLEPQPLPEMPKLPSAYQRVEYIESTGTQYIYGPKFSTSSTTITIWQKPTDKNSARLFYHNGTSTFVREIYLTSNGGLTMPRNYNSLNNEFGHSYNTFIATFVSGYANEQQPYILCKSPNTNMYKGKFYGLKIGTRYLIPCYRLSDGEIGVYATYNSTFYPNAGTGTFLKGKDTESIENFETIGEPIINEHKMTPTNTGWIQTSSDFNPGTKTWRIQFKVTRGSTSNWQNMIHSNGVMIQSGNTTHKLYLNNNSGWDICYGSINKTITDNSTYYIAVEFTGTEYIFEISSDGENWNSSTYSSTTTIKSGKLEFGAKASNTTQFLGTFDLDTIKIWIDNQIWWRAYS